MRDLEGFAKFIGHQLVSPLDSFIQRNRKELFLMKGTEESKTFAFQYGWKMTGCRLSWKTQMQASTGILICFTIF